MGIPGGNKALYIEHITGLSDEQLSLHVTRHLPRRLAAGNVIIVNDRPSVFLAVVRKRWMHVIREIERERSSTLDRIKREHLDREIAHMKGYRFGTQISNVERLEALILTPAEVLGSGLRCLSMYITIPLSYGEVKEAANCIIEKGLLMIYDAQTILPSN
jgi:hypothetical protein